MADHRSDCAVHNGPAMPAGACDCGIDAATAARAEIVAWLRAEALAVRRSGAVTGPEWCDALRLAADRIEGGAPQRWAAERDARG